MLLFFLTKRFGITRDSNKRTEMGRKRQKKEKGQTNSTNDIVGIQFGKLIAI